MQDVLASLKNVVKHVVQLYGERQELLRIRVTPHLLSASLQLLTWLPLACRC